MNPSAVNSPAVIVAFCMRAMRQVALSASALACSGLAAAAPQTFVNYVLDIPAASDPVFVTDPSGWVYATGASSFAEDRPIGVVASGGQVSVTGMASVGSAKVSASGSGAGYTGFAWAGWRDTVTFSGGTTGQNGTVSFDLDFSWQLEVNAPGGNSPGLGVAWGFVDIILSPVEPRASTERYQYASMNQELGGSCVSESGPCAFEPEPLWSEYFGPGIALPTVSGNTATMNFEVVFGRAYTLEVAINADVRGMGSTAYVDATHSLEWGGISSLVDSTGTAQPLSVLSESGFNYAVPLASQVPEPQVWQMFALALVGGQTLRRCRRIRE